MNTTALLLKAQKNGLEIWTGDNCGNVGGRVEYSPRYKGDRKPWLYIGADGVGRFAASDCVAIPPVLEAPVVEDTTKEDAAAEVLKAVRVLLNPEHNDIFIQWAIDTLASAGIVVHKAVSA